MPKKLALLRGINVGGHRKVPMADLRDLAASLGYHQPRTYVASGNLLFETDEADDLAEKKLEAAIARRFGFPVDVIVRSAAAWNAYMTGNPMRKESESQSNWVMIAVGKRAATDDDVAAMMKKASGNERVERAGEVLWIWFAEGAARSKLGTGPAKDIWTTRNWRTVVTLDEMLKA